MSAALSSDLKNKYNVGFALLARCWFISDNIVHLSTCVMNWSDGHEALYGHYDWFSIWFHDVDLGHGVVGNHLISTVFSFRLALFP
jgi:hypothetical protein